MKKTFSYLLIVLALASCKKPIVQPPVDFQSVVACDRIYRVVVDIDGNVWHWASSNHHEDPRKEFVYTNKNFPIEPEKIKTLSNVVSVSLSPKTGKAVAVTDNGLCFTWEYCGSISSTNNIFFYSEQPKLFSSVDNVRYAYFDYVNFVRYNPKKGFDDVDMIKGLFVVHNDGTAEFLDTNEKRYPVKLPDNEKIKYMTELMILSKSGKLYCVKTSDYEKEEMNIELVAENCYFVQLYPNGGSVFQNNGRQLRLSIDSETDVTTHEEMRTNIKFWGRSSYNMRLISYDGMLFDHFRIKVLNTDHIDNLVYLSDDLYLSADGTLFESTGGKYEETSMGKSVVNDTVSRLLIGDKISRVENVKILYTKHLIDYLPSKLDDPNEDNDNTLGDGVYPQ